MVLTTGFPNAIYVQAGGPDDSEGCYELGYNDGQDNGFRVSFYDHCSRSFYLEDGENRYYEGFIDGCIDADNSRETCERFIE
ncbi:MAG: hypothetical protein WBX01_01555 [Nitrososphaeraceae archaeon]